MQTQMPRIQAPPPKQLVYWQKALLWQSLGFLIVVVLTWSDAIFDLAHVILGLPHRELGHKPNGDYHGGDCAPLDVLGV